MDHIVIAGLIAGGWLACGMLAACRVYAHFQRKWPILADRYRSSDTAIALWGIPLGPFALLATILYRHGFLIPGTKDRKS